MTSAIRIGAALVGTLMFVVAEPPELPARDPSRVRPVEISVPRAKPPERSTATEATAADVVRSVPNDSIEEIGRSLQDHDDVEESDRPDRGGREGDGSVVNGDFEGSSVSRGHNFTTSNSDPPGESDD